MFKKLVKILLCFVFVIGFSGGFASGIFASPINWSEENIGESPLSATYFNNILIYTTNNGVFMTKDGETIKSVDRLPSYFTTLHKVSEDALFCSTNDNLYFTKDGVNWVEARIDSKSFDKYPDSAKYILKFKDVFVIVMDYSANPKGSTTAYAYSLDGINWTRSLLVNTSCTVPHIYKNTLYFFQDWFYDGCTYVSTKDGKTLTRHKGFAPVTSINDELTSIGSEQIWSFNNEFMVVGTQQKSDSYYVTNDGDIWRELKVDGKIAGRNKDYFDFTQSTVTVATYNSDGVHYYKKLDNALGLTKPILISNLDTDNLNLTSKELYGGINEKEIFAKFKKTVLHYDDKRHVLERSYDGINFYYMAGALPSLKEAVSNLKSGFLLSGQQGLLLQGIVKDNTATINPLHFNPDGSGIKSLSFANKLYFLCTFAGGLYSSADGINWKGESALPTAINDLVWDGTNYFAASEKGILSSKDAKVWNVAYKSNSAFHSITLGNKKIIACGDKNTILYSVDGIKWLTAKVPKNSYPLYEVSYGSGVYVCGGGGGTIPENSGVLYRSTDGINWSKVSNNRKESGTDEMLDIGAQNTTFEITFTSGTFVATGVTNSGYGFAMTSTDGSNWDLMSDSIYSTKDVYSISKNIVGTVGGKWAEEGNGKFYILNDEMTDISIITSVEHIAPTIKDIITPTFYAKEPEFSEDYK